VENILAVSKAQLNALNEFEKSQADRLESFIDGRLTSEWAEGSSVRMRLPEVPNPKVLRELNNRYGDWKASWQVDVRSGATVEFK
jgi:hypothetical protein